MHPFLGRLGLFNLQDLYHGKGKIGQCHGFGLSPMVPIMITYELVCDENRCYGLLFPPHKLQNPG